MEQNFKLSQPKEIRTAVMNKADVCRELYKPSSIHSAPVRGLLIKNLRVPSGNC
jgi:hypothetical protein